MEEKDKTTAETKPAAEKEKKTETTAGKKEDGSSMLEKAGQEAIKEHSLTEAFVASDGTVFRIKNDATNYAANLKNKTILTVKK